MLDLKEIEDFLNYISYVPKRMKKECVEFIDNSLKDIMTEDFMLSQNNEDIEW